MAAMEILNNKVWKYLWERKVVDIVILRPATLTQLIAEVVKVEEIGINIPDTVPQVITKVVEVGQFLPETIPLVILEDILKEE